MVVQRPPGFIEPCLPSKVTRPPSGPLWVHEIKHDGYRLMVRRDGERVRSFTRNGHDWAERFPSIAYSYRVPLHQPAFGGWADQLRDEAAYVERVKT
jgi:ATP-dependent DNA ligase